MPPKSASRKKVRPPPQPAEMPRPDVFRYEDFRLFLKDWFQYLKFLDRRFSIRGLCRQAGLSAAYFPMILSGNRGMSIETLPQLVPYLKLSRAEVNHLEELIKLGTYQSTDAKLEVLGRMSRRASFKKRYPTEADFFRYASRWFHMAIRELATLPGFKADAEWIQSKLRVKLPLKLIEEAMAFLLQAGYLKETKSGLTASSSETLRTEGPVFWGALTEAHRQMFALATESINDCPPELRNIVGITVPLNESRFAAATEILNRAIEEISALDQKGDAPNDRVYQVELALFPLSNWGDE